MPINMLLFQISFTFFFHCLENKWIANLVFWWFTKRFKRNSQVQRTWIFFRNLLFPMYLISPSVSDILYWVRRDNIKDFCRHWQKTVKTQPKLWNSQLYSFYFKFQDFSSFCEKKTFLENNPKKIFWNTERII